MKSQPTTPQVLQHLLLVQHGTIGSHQHGIVRVQPFKSSVVLLLQCAIEDFRVDAQYLLCRHANASKTIRLLFSLTLFIKFPFLVKTVFYPAYATDLIESWSGTTESPSLSSAPV